jgi:hypothetical protein
MKNQYYQYYLQAFHKLLNKIEMQTNKTNARGEARNGSFVFLEGGTRFSIWAPRREAAC